MEEWVGHRWHRLITRAADRSYPHAAVRLEDVTRAVQLMFRAGGGDAGVRVAPAAAERIGGPRGWLQKVAGQGERAAVTSLDGETLALPPVIAVFDDTALNRSLYLWLAALGACHQATAAGWLAGNLAATRRALTVFPGLRPRYARLLAAHLAQRPAPASLHGSARTAEEAIQAALRGTLPWTVTGEALDGMEAVGAPGLPPRQGAPGPDIHPRQAAPVWLWMQARPAALAAQAAADADEASPQGQKPSSPQTPQDRKRRRAERAEDTSNKNGLMMFFRAESILSWSEFVRVSRPGDDDEDQNASQAADDMDQLALARHGETLAARVKFDLDLPSAAHDDLPVGEGEPLPEWDYRRAALRPDGCRVQRLRPRPGLPALAATQIATDLVATNGVNTAKNGQNDPMMPAEKSAPVLGPIAGHAMPAASASLKASERQVRRRFEALRAAPRWQHGLMQGDELDLDAWVRYQTERCASGPRTESPAIFARRVKHERSLASVVLADLSLSTDAYATQQARVIDLIRDSLLVFGSALDGVGDAFEMLGFSSVRRAVRVHELKRFAEPWNDDARQRVAAIKPGFYTRLGAAIRYGALRLAQRPERQRLLLILSDGKPNDLDQYEGRYGLEDTRHAVHEARRTGLVPFCVTIDQQAHDYLPRLFGAQGFALIHRPGQLARALTQVYVRLTAAAR